MSYDNSNRKSIREAEKVAKLAETNRIAYTRHIMSDIFGREWMHTLLTQCHIFATPFVAGAPDITSFNCGAQNLGLRLFGDVAAYCPHEYTLMMTEASTKEAANERRNESPIDSGSASGSSNGWDPHKPSGTTYSVSPDGFVIVDSNGFVIDSSDESEDA